MLVTRLPFVFRVIITVFAVAACSIAAAQDQETAQPLEFGGEYAALSDAQRALVDDIYTRFTAITGREVDPEEAYNTTRLSVRTTFEAITHALTSSTLTDSETGESLGHPIDLINHLEEVRGKVKGAGGDRQFRLYVALRPGVVNVLERSKEFERKGDNTIFHKGFPINFRQGGGYPSIQFSISRDGTRADIDVDYRSSKFPNALFNGHLTAANSDIRAGNHPRHDGRWGGLVNWWEGFFGRLLGHGDYAAERDQEYRFPLVPAMGRETIDVAVHDFLSSWLVEQQPNQSVAYFDREAFECLALNMEAREQTLDRGLAPIEMYVRMKAVNEELGARASLEEAINGVRFVNPNLRLVRQDHHAQFVLYAVPRAFAESMRCENYTKVGDLPTERRILRDPPESYFSAFFLKGPRGGGMTLGLLWEKREGDWKIVSYEVEIEEETEQNSLPSLAPETQTVALSTASADPALVAANDRFLDAWVVEKNYDDAFAYLSPRCYPCVNLDLDPGEEAYPTRDLQEERLRYGLERFGERVGEVERLEDVFEGIEPWDPRARIVEHPRQEAFGLFAVPDGVGQQAGCTARLARGDTPGVADENTRYGNYYATALKITTITGEAAVLFLGWDKADGDWRVFTYKVVEP